MRHQGHLLCASLRFSHHEIIYPQEVLARYLQIYCVCCTNADIFCYLHQRICPTVALQESLCKWDTYNLKKKVIIYCFSHMLTELLGSASAWQYPGKTPEESVLTRQASHVVGVEEWWSWEQSRAAERGNCWDCTSTTATDAANTTNLTWTWHPSFLQDFVLFHNHALLLNCLATNASLC